jgi:hypothetical protein
MDRSDPRQRMLGVGGPAAGPEKKDGLRHRSLTFVGGRRTA